MGSLAQHGPHQQHLSRSSSGPGPRYTLTNHHTKTHTHRSDTHTPKRYTKLYTKIYTNQLKVQKHTHNSMYMAGYTSSQTSVLQSTSCATVMITRSIGCTHTVTRHSHEHPYRPSTQTGSTAGSRGLSCTETEVCLPISDLARSRAPVAQRDKLEQEHGATGGGEGRPGQARGGDGRQSLLRVSAAAPTFTALRPRPLSHADMAARPISPFSCRLCPGPLTCMHDTRSWVRLVTVTTKVDTKEKRS